MASNAVPSNAVGSNAADRTTVVPARTPLDRLRAARRSMAVVNGIVWLECLAFLFADRAFEHAGVVWTLVILFTLFGSNAVSAFIEVRCDKESAQRLWVRQVYCTVLVALLAYSLRRSELTVSLPVLGAVGAAGAWWLHRSANALLVLADPSKEE